MTAAAATRLGHCQLCGRLVEWDRGPAGFRAYDPVPVVVERRDDGTTTARVTHASTCLELDVWTGFPVLSPAEATRRARASARSALAAAPRGGWYEP